MRQSVRADQADAVSAGETHDQGWTVEALLLVCEPRAKEQVVNEVDLGLAVGTAMAFKLLDELLDVLHLVSLATWHARLRIRPLAIRSQLIRCMTAN